MLVFTSVIVTVTPGSAPPDVSTMLPSMPPLTAWACATPDTTTTSAAAVAHAASVRAKRRAMSILLGTFKSRKRPRALLPGPCRRRELPDPDVSKRDFVAVILQQDVAFDLGAPSRLVLELALRLR